MKKKEYNKALSYFKKAVTIDPEFIPGYYNIAQIYMTQKKYKSAEKYFHEVIKRKPLPEAYLNLGYIHYNLENRKKAKVYFKLYIKFSNDISTKARVKVLLENIENK